MEPACDASVRECGCGSDWFWCVGSSVVDECEPSVERSCQAVLAGDIVASGFEAIASGVRYYDRLDIRVREAMAADGAVMKPCGSVSYLTM